MSYIATNHLLNPLTETNDPLANTLSVTAPRRLVPTVGGRHARAVHDVLRRLYGGRHLTMPHARAPGLLYTRPKIHDGRDALIDPRRRARFAVLAPEDASMPRIA